MQATKEDIGKILYPVDNSYSQDLTTGEYPQVGKSKAGLAGAYNIPAVPVKLVFGPITLETPQTFSLGIKQHEFFIVEYEDRNYLILNNFTEEPSTEIEDLIDNYDNNN